MNAIMLCNVPNLDINHNHSFTFRDLNQQIDYFLSKKVMEFDDTKYHRVGNSIKIPIHFDDFNLMRCNYLLAQNHNQLPYRKTYFYFIVNKEYVNSETTKLTLKLDVIQTYLFDIRFGQCFIERQHYNPYDSNGDVNIDILDRPENLEVGEYIVDKVKTIYDYNNKGGFIVASSTKLSPMTNTGGGSNPGGGTNPGGGSGSSGDTLRNKIVESARKLIGLPYVFGGNYPPLGNSSGTDCSGLCQWAYNDNGISISRTTYTQIEEGIEVNQSDLKPGDLIFSRFSSPGVPEHVFMFSKHGDDGSLWCVEAQQPGVNILERQFTWSSEMVARRIIIASSSDTGVDGTPSAKIFRFLKGFEAFGAYPYYGNGETFRTYGYGVTEPNYPDEFNSMLPAPVSEQKASEVLFDVMYNGFAIPLFNQMKADGVNADNLKQCQFDAFLSLAYNGGLGAVTSSPMYSKFLANPNDESIGTDWSSWYTNGGMAGLVARRQSEYNIYKNGSYEYRAIAQVDSDGYITGIAVSDNNGNGYIPPSCKGDV